VRVAAMPRLRWTARSTLWRAPRDLIARDLLRLLVAVRATRKVTPTTPCRSTYPNDNAT